MNMPNVQKSPAERMPILQRQLAPGFTSEVDAANEETWSRLAHKFDDANIYQTWAYTTITSGARNRSTLILKKNGEVVALAQARIAKVPLINIGIAYIRWGPLWRRQSAEMDLEIFRQAVRALRNEFAFKRGFVLRLLPILFKEDAACFSAILEEEGFSSAGEETRGRTILMDLTPSLEILRLGMNAHWRRELKVAERKDLEIIQGSGDELFGMFINIYKEMLARKKFVEGNDVNQFRMMQQQLPDTLKMKIMLCKSGTEICAGLVCSVIGRTAVYLFGATSNSGMKKNGSYLLHWKLIENLKAQGCAVYDLNGINPARNPGTYKFKNDLAGKHGKDVYFLGRFDSRINPISYWCVEFGDTLRSVYRRFKERSLTTLKPSLGSSSETQS
jgi:lipid II:glycine glycyltransferase (peptidoglycan interpeptide bridge formation enzyme)